MKKVLFVITKSNWGGAQRYVYNLATSLPKEQFDVVVAFGGTGAAHTSPGELQAKLRAAGIRTIEVATFARNVSFGNDLKSVFILRDIFKAEKPDVVHLNSSKAGGVGALAARLAGVPTIIFTSHGLAWDEDRNPLATLLIYIFSQLTFLLCHRVILISKDNYARAHSIFGGAKYVFIPNGIPELTFQTRDSARSELQLRAELPPAIFLDALQMVAQFPRLCRVRLLAHVLLLGVAHGNSLKPRPAR
jgi:glycosyltransferase involved in cell wall biosynthesis